MLWLFSALATADLSSFSIGSQAAFGGVACNRHCDINRFVADEVENDFDFAGEIRAYFNLRPCFHGVSLLSAAYFVALGAGMAPEGRVGANSPSLWPNHVLR